jgi:hypothetical protein
LRLQQFSIDHVPLRMPVTGHELGSS